MRAELDMLLPLVEEMKETVINGCRIYTGRMGANEVAIMQTGIGKVNAAVGALSLIDSFRPDLMVNTGIAGGTGNGADIFDVVIADEIGYHDVYCGPGNARGQVQGLPETFPGATGLFSVEGLQKQGIVKRGLIASGDRFISTPEELAAVLKTRPGAVAVDMESGAIAQVCHLKNVPFLAIRVVSDTPGVENHLDPYCNFWQTAPERTFGILKKLLP